MKQQHKIALAVLIGILVGGVSLRYGQHVVIENFNACIEQEAANIKSIDDILNLQNKCMPSYPVRQIFFW